MVKEVDDISSLNEEQRDRIRKKGLDDPRVLAKATRVELQKAADIDADTATRLKREVGSRSAESLVERGDRQAITPDGWEITTRSATHLAELTHLDPAELVGNTAADLLDDLDWALDPELLGFQQVCGTVRKRNPETGVLEPVPHATVHVEDTDCSFLGFYPSEPPWMWLYPFGCRREVIATVRTDACGHFCVWIPRWEIDRILRFRRERVCLPELVKPNVEDLLDGLLEVPEVPIPRPRPDPVPILFDRPATFDRVAETLGEDVASELGGRTTLPTFGESVTAERALLDRPGFIEPRLPPLPSTVEELPDLNVSHKRLMASANDRELPLLDRHRFVGPFLPCRDVIVPEWVTVTDVPDVTFRVTQDVDGDGEEETIYDEGFFDIRWNEDPIPDVTLLADEHALSTPTCEVPEITPGECGELRLLTAGLMSLNEPYHDSESGYARRPNRPWSGGQPGAGTRDDTKTPYTGTLQLHGCVRVDDAEHYRVLYSYEGNAPVPFTDFSWYVPRLDPTATHYHMSPDAEGWYEIPPKDELVFPYWVLNWPTHRGSDGRYDVSIEVADGDKVPIEGGSSEPIAIYVDNSKPDVTYSIEHYDPGTGSWTPVEPECPVIWRSPGETVQLRATYSATADHFRNVSVYALGCGNDPERPDGEAAYGHWYTDPVTDTGHNTTAHFNVQPGLPDGTYTIGIHAHGRSFNPSGEHGGPTTDWYYDHPYSHAHPRRRISIVTE